MDSLDVPLAPWAAGTLHRSGNDTGPDDANHDPEGIFIAARMADLRKGRRIARYIGDASCLDITPTILHEFGLSAPAEMTGKVINLDPKEGVINPEFSSLVLEDRQLCGPVPQTFRWARLYSRRGRNYKGATKGSGLYLSLASLGHHGGARGAVFHFGS